MTEMQQKATEKIDREAEAGKGLKPFAQYIIDELIVSDSAAKKILDESKSLKKCFDAVIGKAKKQAVGNCAAVDDDVVYSWIRDYFGFTEIPVSTQTENPAINDIVAFDVFADL